MDESSRYEKSNVITEYSLPNAHLASLGQRHHTFQRCCMVLKYWPQPSQFPLLLERSTLCFAGQMPFPQGQHWSGVPWRSLEKVKMEGSMEVYVSICIAARVTLFTLSLHCCRLARLTRAFNSLRFSGSSTVVACQPSFHTCWTTIFGFFLGGGIAGFCRHIACLGFSRSFMLQDPLNVYLVANDFSTKTSLNNNDVSHPLFPCGLCGSASFSFTARFLRCTKPLVLSYSAPESQS